MFDTFLLEGQGQLTKDNFTDLAKIKISVQRRGAEFGVLTWNVTTTTSFSEDRPITQTGVVKFDGDAYDLAVSILSTFRTLKTV